MFKRQMVEEFKRAAADYPVVTITGPRQSGKTTLVQTTFPDKPYANLESLRTRELADADPVGFLDRYPEGAIIDEIQRLPKLLSEIQVRVDEKKRNGMFILTGSHQVELRGAIAQSLAGRTVVLHLLPMSIVRLAEAGFDMDLDTLLYTGCYPRIYDEGLDPTKMYGSYVQTYLERDLRQMIEVKNLTLFQKFVKLCAGRIGQILNKEGLAGEVGVSARTIGEWLSILEASYLIFLLPPYHENFGKRAIKSPKIYFCDVGLASYLLGIESPKQMERDPIRGHLVENLVLLEMMKARLNRGLDPRLYFYRDVQKLEVDILYQKGHQLVPVEVKSAKTFHRSFLDGLLKFQRLVGERCIDPTLVYGGSEEQMVNGIRLLNLYHAEQITFQE